MNPIVFRLRSDDCRPGRVKAVRDAGRDRFGHELGVAFQGSTKRVVRRGSLLGDASFAKPLDYARNWS